MMHMAWWIDRRSRWRMRKHEKDVERRRSTVKDVSKIGRKKSDPRGRVMPYAGDAARRCVGLGFVA
jgi:hypothetical protein